MIWWFYKFGLTQIYRTTKFTDISTITSCNFRENNDNGGAISLRQGKSPSIRLCNLTEDNTTYFGAIYLTNDWPSSIHSCNLHANNALRFGGSTNSGFTDISTITSCNFIENNATYGGAISLSQGRFSSIRLRNFCRNKTKL